LITNRHACQDHDAGFNQCQVSRLRRLAKNLQAVRAQRGEVLSEQSNERSFPVGQGIFLSSSRTMMGSHHFCDEDEPMRADLQFSKHQPVESWDAG